MRGEEGALASSPYDEWGRDPGAPILTRLAALGVGGVLRAIYATVHVKFVQPEFHERVNAQSGGTYIGVFWHKNIGLGSPFYPKRVRRVCLVSRSLDGELLARIMSLLGSRTIRGSSARMDGSDKGGSSALRQLARASEAGYHLVVTPDGPKGPPEQIKPGVIHLAGMTGRPILPIGMAASRVIRLSTWDGTLIPIPFAHLAVSYGELLEVPRTGDSAEMESIREEVERRLTAADEQARASLQTSGD